MAHFVRAGVPSAPRNRITLNHPRIASPLRQPLAGVGSFHGFGALPRQPPFVAHAGVYRPAVHLAEKTGANSFKMLFLAYGSFSTYRAISLSTTQLAPRSFFL